MRFHYPHNLDLRLALLLLLSSGCTPGRPASTNPTSRPVAVPAGANLIANHAGAGVFVMQQDGVLYIVDDSSGELVYCSPVMLGQRLLFLPERNQIILNGVVVKSGGLSATRSYRFLFSKE